MREFLFSRSTWLIETMSQMMAATARGKRKVRDEDVDSSDDESGIDDDEEESKEGEESEEEVYIPPASGELTQLEKQINENRALHPMPNVNTHVHACKTCSIWLLDFTSTWQGGFISCVVWYG